VKVVIHSSKGLCSIHVLTVLDLHSSIIYDSLYGSLAHMMLMIMLFEMLKYCYFFHYIFVHLFTQTLIATCSVLLCISLYV